MALLAMYGLKCMDAQSDIANETVLHVGTMMHRRSSYGSATRSVFDPEHWKSPLAGN